MPTSSFFNAVMAAAAKKSVEELLGRPTSSEVIGVYDYEQLVGKASTILLDFPDELDLTKASE